MVGGRLQVAMHILQRMFAILYCASAIWILTTKNERKPVSCTQDEMQKLLQIRSYNRRRFKCEISDAEIRKSNKLTTRTYISRVPYNRLIKILLYGMMKGK